jgi:hypothetical protein
MTPIWNGEALQVGGRVSVRVACMGASGAREYWVSCGRTACRPPGGKGAAARAAVTFASAQVLRYRKDQKYDR